MRLTILAGRRKTLGDDYPSALWSMYDFARSLKSAGRLDEAITLLDEAVAAVQKAFAEDE